MAYDGSGITQAYAGANMGMQDLYAGMHVGASRMTADLGAMMPTIAAPNMHPMMQARHGMYSHEMSFGGSAMALMGRGIPETTSAYEYQEMAARDMGQRVAGATTMGAFYGGSAALGWWGGAAAISKGYKAGRSVGRGAALAKMGYAKNIGGMMGLMKTGSTAAKFGMRAAGVGAGLAGALPAMVAFEGLAQYTEAVVDDVQDRRDVMNFVEASSWRYAEGSGKDIDKKHGGFNRQARAKIADKIKSIDYADSSYGMKDLKGLLEAGTEMGMFGGVKDAEEFGEKFKDLTSTLKKVTTTLHQSLSEGLKTIKGLKEMGFRTAGDMSGAIMNADILGSASGKTAAEMLSYGRQGSEMVRGTGISMSAGANMMMQNTASISGLKTGGYLSAEALAQAGGENALAQQMMAGNVNFMRSNMGRGLSLAMAGADGGIDPSALNSLTSGALTPNQIMGMGSKNVSTTGQFVKNYVNQAKRTQQISEAYGGQGIELTTMGADITAARSLQEMSPDIDSEDAYKMVMMKRGMSDTAIQATLGKLKSTDEQRNTARIAARKQASKLAGEIVRRRTDLTGRFGDWAHSTAVAPVSSGLSNFYDEVASKTEGAYSGTRDWFQEKVFGIKKIELQEIKNEDILGIIAQNSDIGGPKVSQRLSSQDFTDAESKAFAKGKSDEYMELQGKYGLKATSSFAMSALDINKYSERVFDKKWDELSKDEKMYAESRIQRAGGGRLKDQIDRHQEGARERISDARADFMAGSEEKIEEAQDDLTKVFAPMGRKMGLFGPMHKVVSELFGEDNEMAKKFETILDTKETIKKLSAEKISAELEGKEFKKGKELSEAITTIDELSDDIGTALEGKGSVGEGAAKRFKESILKKDFTGTKEGFSKAIKTLETSKGSAAYRQLIGTTKDTVEAYSTLKAGKFKDADDQEDYLEAVSKFKSSLGSDGKELDEDDYADLAKYAGKGGLQSMAFLGKLGAEFEKRGGEMSPDAAAKFLKSVGGIEVTKDKLKAAFGGEVSTKEIMNYAAIRELSQKGGMKVIGAESGDEQITEAAGAAVKLIEVQRRAEILINRYEILAEKAGL